MLPRTHPGRIQIAFDDHRLVANAGLLLPATLAHHLGLPQLGRFAANGAWLAIQSLPRTRYGVMAHITWPAGQRTSLWVSRWRPPRPSGGGSSPWPDGSSARPAVSPCICHRAGRGRRSSAAPWPGSEPFHFQPDGTRLPPTRPAHNRGSRKLAPPRSASGSFRVLCPHLAPRPIVDRHRCPQERLQAARRPPAYPNQARIIAPVTPSHPSAVLTPSTCTNRWIRAKAKAFHDIARC